MAARSKYFNHMLGLRNMRLQHLWRNVSVHPHDLAIFAKCNHTIITKGAMSKWASVLSGGEYYTEYGPVVPHSVNENIPRPEVDDMTELLDQFSGEGMDQYMPMRFGDADFENDVKIFWWEDIISYIKYDLYYWLTSSIGSLLPF